MHIDWGDGSGNKEVNLNNPLIERLTMRILLGSEYDLSSCENLRELFVDCECDFRRLDLSMCQKLERLECWGASYPINLHKLQSPTMDLLNMSI